MGFISEARMMLDAADKAAGSPATRLGWLVLAKGSVAAAITEATKGTKDADGHVPSSAQPSLPFAARGPAVEVNGDGVVMTPADTAEPDTDEPETPDPAWDEFAATPEPLPEQPSGATYDEPGLLEHQRHVALNPGIYAEDCEYCMVAAGAHRPDPGDTIPDIGDSRGKPDDEGTQ